MGHTETEYFEIYYRRLPHWRASHNLYFVTWRLAAGTPLLGSVERSVVARTIEHFHTVRYMLSGYVVMDDHVHVLVRPTIQTRLHTIVHSWKSYSARDLQRRTDRVGRVWQREYFDRIVRDQRELVNTLEYVVGNPCKRWPSLDGYPWLRIFDPDSGRPIPAE